MGEKKCAGGRKTGDAALPARQSLWDEPEYGLDRKEKLYAYLFITMNKYSIDRTA